VVKHWCHFARDRAGTAMLEVGLVLPLLLALAYGTCQFGFVCGAFVWLTNAAAAGAQTFAICGAEAADGTPCPTPYTTTHTAVQNAAGFLASHSTLTITVNGTACTSDATCTTALQNQMPTATSSSTPNVPAAVTVKYPCPNLLLISQSALAWLHIAAASGQPWSFCPMTITIEEIIP
jgi:Flp pilus assembly protein TadG